MGKYLHRFDAEEDFNAAYNGEDYIEPWVSYTNESGRVDYNKSFDLEIYYTNNGEVQIMPDGARILHASEGIGIVEEIETQYSATEVGYSYIVNGPYIVSQTPPKETLSGTLNYNGITIGCTFSYDTEQSLGGKYVWVAPIQSDDISELYGVEFECTFDTENNVWKSKVKMSIMN